MARRSGGNGAHRNERMKSLIARDIAQIVHDDIKKSSVGLVSVNEVIVSSDLSYAKVFVSFLPEDHPKTRLAELKKTEGFVRSALARKLSIYKVPEIHFFIDETAARSARIEAALAKEEADLSKLPSNDEENIEENEKRS